MTTEKTYYLASITCQERGYAHNQRCRYTHGYSCETCYKFIEKGTLEYFMTEQHSSIDLAIHNRTVSFRRGEVKIDVAPELLQLQKQLEDGNFLHSLNEEEATKFMEHTYKILNMYLVNDEEATLKLK